MATPARDRLRLCLVTDGRGDLARIERVVDAVLANGCRCVQLREFAWSARELTNACDRLRPRLEAHDGWLLVNDRIDVAASGAAHGVQLGHRSLSPAVGRRLLGAAAVVGYSAHDAAQLDEAAAADCDFALLSPVWPTASKPDAVALGLTAAAELTAAAALPVVWLGGVTAERCAAIGALPEAQRPAGVAAVGALMAATDPAQAAAALRRSW